MIAEKVAVPSPHWVANHGSRGVPLKKPDHPGGRIEILSTPWRGPHPARLHFGPTSHRFPTAPRAPHQQRRAGGPSSSSAPLRSPWSTAWIPRRARAETQNRQAPASLKRKARKTWGAERLPPGMGRGGAGRPASFTNPVAQRG